MIGIYLPYKPEQANKQKQTNKTNRKTCHAFMDQNDTIVSQAAEGGVEDVSPRKSF